MGLAVVRDMREARVPAGPDGVAAFETDVLAGFVLARAAAGLSDKTISADVSNLGQVRAIEQLREVNAEAAQLLYGVLDEVQALRRASLTCSGPQCSHQRYQRSHYLYW